jgi:rSAM-associated Gly-rich repeat protein
MAPRSLLHLLTAIAAAALFTKTAEAAVYQAPDLRNPLEGRIQALREGSGQALFNPNTSSAPSDINPAGDTQISWWGNGGGRGWGNGGFRRAWGNGGGDGSWRINSGGWGNGGGWINGGGWPNGGGWGNGGGSGGFLNW